MPITDRNLKPGTRLTAKYKKKVYAAEVIGGKDGQVRFRLADGREFASPSAAGKAVMGGVACNGWRFWSLVNGDGPTDAPRAHTGANSASQASPSPTAPPPPPQRPNVHPQGRRAAPGSPRARPRPKPPSASLRAPGR